MNLCDRIILESGYVYMNYFCHEQFVHTRCPVCIHHQKNLLYSQDRYQFLNFNPIIMKIHGKNINAYILKMSFVDVVKCRYLMVFH